MTENLFPKISVISPTYNSAAFVERTLRSVSIQTVPPFELIVSDDGSTDATRTIVRRFAQEASFPIRLIKNPHKGPGAARNAGIRVAAGAWIAFLDSDDCWKPEKIEHTITAIAHHPEINFFCHDQYHRFLDGREEPLRLAERYRHMILARQLFRNCPFATSAVVCRKDLLLEHGLFDEALMSAQDFELWLRLSPFLRVYFIPEVLGWYNDRPGSISSKKQWRHLKNVLWALSKNRNTTKRRWFLLGIILHIAVFCKNRIMHHTTKIQPYEQ